MDTFDLSPMSGLSGGFNWLGHDLDGAVFETDGGDHPVTAMPPPRHAAPLPRHHRDVAIVPPTRDEVRVMVGCSDLAEDGTRRRLRLLEAGIRRRHPAMADGKVEAAVARITRALSPPVPPGDLDWETIRRRRAGDRPGSGDAGPG